MEVARGPPLFQMAISPKMAPSGFVIISPSGSFSTSWPESTIPNHVPGSPATMMLSSAANRMTDRRLARSSRTSSARPWKALIDTPRACASRPSDSSSDMSDAAADCRGSCDCFSCGEGGAGPSGGAPTKKLRLRSAFCRVTAAWSFCSPATWPDAASVAATSNGEMGSTSAMLFSSFVSALAGERLFCCAFGQTDRLPR